MNLKTVVSAIAAHGKTFANTAMTVAKGHSPAIFAGTAIVGAFVIGYTAYKCTPKYKQAVEQASHETVPNEYGQYTEEVAVEPTKATKAKIFVKTMWPVMVAILVTCTSIVASHKISAKRIALLSAAYTTATQKASEAAEKKAEEFIKEKLGDDAAKEYKDAVAEEKKANEKILSTVSGGVIETGGGDDLIVDFYSGQVFKGSQGYIEAKLEALNENLRSNQEESITYSDVLEFLGLNATGMGDYMGFCVDGGRNDWPLKAYFKPGQTTDGKVCWVMHFSTAPVMLYEV